VPLELQCWHIITIICSKFWWILSIESICYFTRRVDPFLPTPSVNVQVSVATVSYTWLSVPVILCVVWRHAHEILLLPASTVDTWQCYRLEGLASFTFVPVGSSFQPRCYILPPLACHHFVQYYIGTGCFKNQLLGNTHIPLRSFPVNWVPFNINYFSSLHDSIDLMEAIPLCEKIEVYIYIYIYLFIYLFIYLRLYTTIVHNSE